MLKSIGFRNIHIYLINFFETLIYIIIGSVIGVAASAIFISLIGSFLKDMLLIAISFLKRYGLTKVELIAAGYQALQNQYGPNKIE